MNILITGATGFIGKKYITRFADNQYAILTRNIERAERILGKKHTYLTEISQIPPDTKFDVIINLAGEPIADKRWTRQQKKKLQLSRWDITQDLVDWIKAAKHKPHCFLSGSAIGVYGTSESAVFTEASSPELQDFSSGLCQRWEDIAMNISDLTRVVLLRTGVVLAADGGAVKKMILPFKLGLGGKIGSGDQWMSWIHIDDYLNAIDFFIREESCQGPYNLTSPHPVKNSEFTRLLATALNKPSFMTAPAFLMKIILGEASTLVLDGQKVLPEKLLDQGFVFTFMNYQDAVHDLFTRQ
jgi:uncharacterized protein (TIGR01777 family)